MALSKTKELSTGVVITHWEIAAYSVTLQVGKEWISQRAENNMFPMGMGLLTETATDGIHVLLNGYLNETAFTNGKLPLETTEVLLPVPQDMALADEILPYIHDTVPTLTGWEDATVV